MIVDDFPDNVEALSYLLEDEGATVVGVSDPRVALKAVTESHFDVLLLDLKMPWMTGHELLKASRALGVTTPAFALSADTASEQINAASTDFARYFTKPYDIDQFLTALRDFLNES